MKSRALEVPRGEAERVRRSLREAEWLRSDLAVSRKGDLVYFPVTDEATPFAGHGTLVEHDFEPVKRPPASYRDHLTGVPAEVLPSLPRAFDVVGDIVLLHLPDEVLPWKESIGRALLEFVPRARVVGWDRGVHGPERRRSLVRLAGEGPFLTRHRENGLDIEVDLERAYFSPRLASEHRRVAAEVKVGERVFDLCCGVGPFALTIARDGRAREVVAVDINPDAIALLTRNLERLRLGARVRPVVADVAEFLPHAGTADRAILNLPHEGIKYLTSVASHVEPGGVLHYYEIMERSEARDRPAALAGLLGAAGNWRVRSSRVVHPYAPTSDLVGFVLERAREDA